jgi:endonuclease YncB( thermonuclease family)
MVQSGYAAVYENYNNESHYLVAMASAQKQGVGIWARKGLHQKPWEWRRKNKK